MRAEGAYPVRRRAEHTRARWHPGRDRPAVTVRLSGRSAEVEFAPQVKAAAQQEFVRLLAGQAEQRGAGAAKVQRTGAGRWQVEGDGRGTSLGAWRDARAIALLVGRPGAAGAERERALRESGLCLCIGDEQGHDGVLGWSGVGIAVPPRLGHRPEACDGPLEEAAESLVEAPEEEVRPGAVAALAGPTMGAGVETRFAVVKARPPRAGRIMAGEAAQRIRGHLMERLEQMCAAEGATAIGGWLEEGGRALALRFAAHVPGSARAEVARRSLATLASLDRGAGPVALRWTEAEQVRIRLSKGGARAEEVLTMLASIRECVGLNAEDEAIRIAMEHASPLLLTASTLSAPRTGGDDVMTAMVPLRVPGQAARLARAGPAPELARRIAAELGMAPWPSAERPAHSVLEAGARRPGKVECLVQGAPAAGGDHERRVIRICEAVQEAVGNAPGGTGAGEPRLH